MIPAEVCERKYARRDAATAAITIAVMRLAWPSNVLIRLIPPKKACPAAEWMSHLTTFTCGELWPKIPTVALGARTEMSGGGKG